jgi:hypothetical protein
MATYGDNTMIIRMNFKNKQWARWILLSHQFRVHHLMPLHGVMKKIGQKNTTLTWDIA